MNFAPIALIRFFSKKYKIQTVTSLLLKTYKYITSVNRYFYPGCDETLIANFTGNNNLQSKAT